MSEELSLVKLSIKPEKKQSIQAPVRKAPPRPTAPPSRPSAPATRTPGQGQNGGRTDPPKAIRPAPAPPGGADTDSDFFSSSPVTSVASTVSNYSLACLTWPEEDSQDLPQQSVNYVYQPPPVPTRASRSCFSQPSLSTEPPNFPPPSPSPEPPAFFLPSPFDEPPPFSPPSLPPDASLIQFSPQSLTSTSAAPPSEPPPAPPSVPVRLLPPPTVPRRR